MERNMRPQTICYYVSSPESISKRKYILLLEKFGFNIKKVRTREQLQDVFSTESVFVVLCQDEYLLDDVFAFYHLVPVIVMMTDLSGVPQLIDRYEDKPNRIFFRSENDPMDTLIETIRMLVRCESITAVAG